MPRPLAHAALLGASLLLLDGCQCGSIEERATLPARTERPQEPTTPPETAPETAPETTTEETPPGPTGRRDVSAMAADAQRAAIGDVDGDGANEIVLVGPLTLRVVTPDGGELASTPARGGVQVLSVVDLDGDGRAEILVGWGRTLDHRDAPARASIYRLSGGTLAEDLVLAPETERAEIVALAPWPGAAGEVGVLVAWFESRFVVASARAVRSAGGWELSPLARIRMATSYALGDVDGDGALDLVVGRLYGDGAEAHGDAFVLREDGTRLTFPTLRGVRGLTLADTDGDGRAEVFLGDGWHREYGRLARAQLTRAVYAEGVFRSEPVMEGPGEFTLWQVVAADLYGDPHPALVARGNLHVHVVRRTSDGFASVRVAGEATHVAVGDLDGLAGDELLVLGPSPQILTFR